MEGAGSGGGGGGHQVEEEGTLILCAPAGVKRGGDNEDINSGAPGEEPSS